MATTYLIYDLATDVGQLREWLTDNDPDNPIWSDQQLAYYFSIANNKVVYTLPATISQILLACAVALEMNANRLSFLATKQKIAIFQEDTVVTYESVMKQAAFFRMRAGMEGGVVVSTPDNFYPLKNDTANPYSTDTTKRQPTSSLDTW